jgi:hypothetical protein
MRLPGRYLQSLGNASGGGTKVGNGWNNARLVFSGGNGVIYAIQQNGDLLWCGHDGWGDGSVRWTSGDGSKIGGGWSVSQIFAM